MRLGFELLTGLALAAYMQEGRIRLRVPAPFGPEAAWNFACIVSVLGVMIAVGMIITLAVFSGKNSNKVNRIASQYQTIIATVGESAHGYLGVQYADGHV